MAIGNIDLSREIENWKSAVRGEDVRSANVAAFEKIQGTVNDTVQNVNQAAEDSASAAHNAQAAVDSIQAAIVTATEKAAAAATSATQAAGSQAAAASSKTAAEQSETNAAASAAEARQIAEGFGGFDGTAASVKVTDTYGLVIDALGESTTQALIDAVANKVINELIAKSNIVNNLLATEVGTVLSGALGPIIDQRLTDLMNKYTQLNGELCYRFTSNVSESPMDTFKKNWSALPELKTSIGAVANINFAAGFIVYKHSANYGAVYMFSYSDAYPVPMFARLVNGTWISP